MAPRIFSVALTILFCASSVLSAAPFATISGLVWRDADADGVRTTTEELVQGAMVVVLNTDGTPIPGAPLAVTTPAAGTYSITYDVAMVNGFTASNTQPEVIVRFTLPAAQSEDIFTAMLPTPEIGNSDVNPLTGDAGPYRLGNSPPQPPGVVTPPAPALLTLSNIDAGITDPSMMTGNDTGDGTGDGGGGDTGGDNNNDNNDDNQGITQLPGGIEVDAAGTLMLRRQVDRTRELARLRAQEMRAAMDPILARPSPSRKISLNRLEQLVAKEIQATGFVPDDMAFLAGLTRIQHVFLFPESGDIVIAGPAEGFAPDEMGRVVGMKSGASTLQLQDLIVALRCFLPGERPTPLIGCSIDPTQEGLERMQQFIRSVGNRLAAQDDLRLAAGLKNSLGPQVVTVEGVPSNTHFAQVLVEADYRMKLIGIGLETPPVAITSYIKRASPSSVARNALQRWYFVPNYESVRVSDDGLAMELVGEGVKLVGANELVQRDGRRRQSGRVDRASQVFVRSFTQRYAALARKEPVFGQLRNLIDMSIVAAFLQQEDVYGQLGWDMAIFANESLVPVETYPTPKTVEAAINVVWKGGTLMTPIGGGVSIETSKALDVNHRLADEDGALQSAREQVTMPELAEGQWWWD